MSDAYTDIAKQTKEALKRVQGATMTKPQTEHCKNEGRCFDFTMAPKEWRKNNVCRICGCDGDTRPAKESSDKVLDRAIDKITAQLNDRDRNWKGMQKSIKILAELRTKERERGV